MKHTLRMAKLQAAHKRRRALVWGRWPYPPRFYERRIFRVAYETHYRLDEMLSDDEQCTLVEATYFPGDSVTVCRHDRLQKRPTAILQIMGRRL